MSASATLSAGNVVVTLAARVSITLGRFSSWLGSAIYIGSVALAVLLTHLPPMQSAAIAKADLRLGRTSFCEPCCNISTIASKAV